MRIIRKVTPFEVWQFDDDWENAPEWVKLDQQQPRRQLLRSMRPDGSTEPYVYCKGGALAEIGDFIAYDPSNDRYTVLTKRSVETDYAVITSSDPEFDAFVKRSMDEYVGDLELDVAGTEAQDLARRLMRPFLDWMTDASGRSLNTKVFVVAYAHFIGWTAFMVNRSTRTDEEFLNGLDNLIGLITNEAYAITSAEERDANFVVHDLLDGLITNSEGEIIEDPEAAFAQGEQWTEEQAKAMQALETKDRVEIRGVDKDGKAKLDG